MSIKKEGKMFVSKKYFRSGEMYQEDVENQPLEISPFETDQLATVSASVGMTINLGNYESLRVDCGITLPTYLEEIEDAQETAFRLVEQELFRRVLEVKNNL